MISLQRVHGFSFPFPKTQPHSRELAGSPRAQRHPKRADAAVIPPPFSSTSHSVGSFHTPIPSQPIPFSSPNLLSRAQERAKHFAQHPDAMPLHSSLLTNSPDFPARRGAGRGGAGRGGVAWRHTWLWDAGAGAGAAHSAGSAGAPARWQVSARRGRTAESRGSRVFHSTRRDAATADDLCAGNSLRIPRMLSNNSCPPRLAGTRD